MNINCREFLIDAGAVDAAALGGCKLPSYCGLGEGVCIAGQEVCRARRYYRSIID